MEHRNIFLMENNNIKKIKKIKINEVVLILIDANYNRLIDNQNFI